MKSINWVWLIGGAILFLAPGFAIGSAWWTYFRPSTKAHPRAWNAVNLAALILQTSCYLFVVSGVLFLTPLRESMVLSWIDRHSFPIVDAAMLTGFLGGTLAICGRGAARIQVAVAGLLLTLMSLFMFWAMSID